MASISTARRRKHLIAQLIRASQGRRPPSPVGSYGRTSPPPPPAKLPCFPLQRHHFGQLTSTARTLNADGIGISSDNSRAPGVAAPSDFHSYLCNAIRCARERVVLASLYIGVGSNTIQVSTQIHDGATDEINCKEDALLEALRHAASNPNLKKLQILLDANRALRKVSVTNKNRQSHGSSSGYIRTSSAEAVFSRINPVLGRDPKSEGNGLFLFPVNDRRLCAILPSPLDEVAGVFHIKAYIVDDELILSGANLSEEYFSNRLDRYLLFTHGGGGLVNFYAELCDLLCEYAIRYDGYPHSRADNLKSLFSLQEEEAKKKHLEESLMHLFDGNNHATESENSTAPIVAYATPTFQMPISFLGRPLQFQSDTEITRNLLISALNGEQSSSVRLSSAYLNLPSKLLSVLTMGGKKNNVGVPYILTAGTISHGFAPKSGRKRRKQIAGFVDSIKETIPKAFLTLVKKNAQSVMSSGGKILLYERPGWTFHAKGIWINTEEDNRAGREKINNSSLLLATIIGSGNYGARSEDLDVESNCILVFDDPDEGDVEMENKCTVKEYMAAEWNNMCDSSKELRDVAIDDNGGKVMRVVLEFAKRYL